VEGRDWFSGQDSGLGIPSIFPAEAGSATDFLGELAVHGFGLCFAVDKMGF